MPGGKVEEGESLMEAAIRETKEECGLEIEVTKFCGIFQDVKQSLCNELIIAKPIGGKLITTPECLEAGFLLIGLNPSNFSRLYKKVPYRQTFLSVYSIGDSLQWRWIFY